MYKIYYIVIFLFCFTSFKAQSANPEISTDLPKVIPPSPTVSALMKYVEIPVSNYSGIPNISIPLFSETSHSKNINLDISLTYHPSSVAVDERASDVGLGWSLNAGGTISRTVRGIPDELLQLPSNSPGSSPDGKIGIYQNNISNHNNNYYYFINNITSTSQNWYKPNLSQVNQDIGNEFLWNAAVKGKYDTEYDLWQFNFMGYSGKFIIKKNENNVLQVVPLSDYRIKIINNYDINSFSPNSFTVFDEKGYQYVFDVIETSVNRGGVRTTTYIPDSNGNSVLSSNDTVYSDREFKSSFHLSKIYDNNNQLLISFNFKDQELKEGFTNSTIATTVFPNISQSIDDYYALYNHCGDLPPLETVTNSTTIIKVKKLESIDIVNKSKIGFNFLQGREDTNILNNNQTSYLQSISIKNVADKLIKKFTFEYDYRITLQKRMFLKKINILKNDNSSDGNYSFDYYNIDTQGKMVSKDAWGFFNLINSCNVTSINNKKTSPEFSYHELLRKIKNPTGGSTIFDFEANRYSHIGNQSITDFSENDFFNQNIENLNFTFTDQINTQALPVSTFLRKVLIYPSTFEATAPATTDKTMVLRKKVNGEWQEIKGLLCPFNNNSCCFEAVLEPNTEYDIRRHNMDLLNNEADYASVEFFKIVTKKFLFGGGNRIKKISYFLQDISPVYDTATITANTEKEFSYELNSDSEKSSGSLVFSKPVFESNDMVATNIGFSPYSGYDCPNPNFITHSFITTNTVNFLPAIKTQGSDVGYKDVVVSETNKGKIYNQFTSPIDYPEENIAYGPPFAPTCNYDYKRGLLLNEKISDHNDNLLTETVKTYSFENFVTHTGTRFRRPYGQCFTGSGASYLNSYVNYKDFITSPNQECTECSLVNYKINKSFVCPLPLDQGYSNPILLFPIFEAYGWAKTDSVKTKSYFYNMGNQKITKTNETFSYNNINKNISEHNITNPDGVSMKTKYFYDIGNNSIYSQNRISDIKKIEIYKNNLLIEKKEVDYVNSWVDNVSYLPQSVKTFSLQNSVPSEEIIYNKYDSKGNILQFTVINGISTSIIWGYNSTQPIAKIEGATYADVQNLATAIITASDADAGAVINNDESALLNALDIFRRNPALANFQVTTYTYDPLIGVRSITPPSGIREYYFYDSANRLEFIKTKDDAGFKILKEFKYNYKQ